MKRMQLSSPEMGQKGDEISREEIHNVGAV